MQMRTEIRQYVLVLAVAMGLAITGGTGRAAASPASQDQGQDYSKNKTYQQGMREGRDDYAHKLDHSKKRHFKKDDDQKAYEAGYQQGHQGDQPDHR
jgi:hypothetical protein